MSRCVHRHIASRHADVARRGVFYGITFFVRTDTGENMQHPATHYKRQGLQKGGNQEAETDCLRWQGKMQYVLQQRISRKASVGRDFRKGDRRPRKTSFPEASTSLS